MPNVSAPGRGRLKITPVYIWSKFLAQPRPPRRPGGPAPRQERAAGASGPRVPRAALACVAGGGVAVGLEVVVAAMDLRRKQNCRPLPSRGRAAARGPRAPRPDVSGVRSLARGPRRAAAGHGHGAAERWQPVSLGARHPAARSVPRASFCRKQLRTHTQAVTGRFAAGETRGQRACGVGAPAGVPVPTWRTGAQHAEGTRGRKTMWLPRRTGHTVGAQHMLTEG